MTNGCHSTFESQKQLFCQSLTTATTAGWSQGTDSFGYPSGNGEKSITLNAKPAPSMDTDKVDCADSVAFCDFSSLPNPTYTYRLEIDWYGARYVVGPDYGGSGGSQPQTSFVKFDPTNLRLSVSGITYSTDRYHSGPINFYLCVNELSDHCSSAFVLNYSDRCQANSLSWTDDKHITDENGDVNVDAANNNALSYTLPLQDTGLGVWIP